MEGLFDGIRVKRIFDRDVDVDGYDAFVIKAESAKTAEDKDAAGDGPIGFRFVNLLPGGLDEAGRG